MVCLFPPCCTSVWGLFSFAQVLRSESGLVVAVFMGIVLRANNLPKVACFIILAFATIHRRSKYEWH